ncbi:MAG: hypothetical protein KDK39_08675 [Leptospiraceae bacterium]|nr:hypothetical protein [Leptospiraceae bacterium]
MQTDLVQQLVEQAHEWQLSFFSVARRKCDAYTLSPDKNWLILELHFSQEPEDRYESEIIDREFILVQLAGEQSGQEAARFRYYYNYNSYADYTQEFGSGYRWTDQATLVVQEQRFELNQMPGPAIKAALAAFY